MTSLPSSHGGERAAIERLGALLGRPPAGEVWVGDDAAVLAGSATPLLFATDVLVEGVHFDRTLSSDADVGWKALTTNLSDLAAMGGRPLAAVIGVIGAGDGLLEALYRGLLEASEAYDCPIVGGDLSEGPELVVSVAVLGAVRDSPPVLRSGGQVGDRLFVTGPLGGAAAGLRLLRADPRSTSPLTQFHRRPRPRMAEGAAAGRLGASAMLDLSDGLGIDVDRLALASGLGVALTGVPIHEGASEEEALGGGDDYELLFSAPATLDIVGGFTGLGLEPPIEIGELVAEVSTRTLRGAPLAAAGFEHRWSGAP